MSAVYIARDEAGAALYVGRTGDLTRRLHTHHSAAWWQPDVTFEVRMCSCTADAVVLEADLIGQLDPPFNVSHSRSGISARPGERVALVLKALHDAGHPLTSAEIRMRTRYANTSKTLWHLRNADRVKVVAITPSAGRYGWMATWALPSWPDEEVALPTERVAS